MYHNFSISNEQQTIDLGRKLSQAAQLADIQGSIIYLEGNLGVGKTTLIRGFIQSLDPKEKVKSPTYTLVEPYEIGRCEINHFDFYRLDDPNECEQMGIRDYLHDKAFCFIEWPQKGEGILPKPDMTIQIEAQSAHERQVQISTQTELGGKWLTQMLDMDA